MCVGWAGAGAGAYIPPLSSWAAKRRFEGCIPLCSSCLPELFFAALQENAEMTKEWKKTMRVVVSGALAGALAAPAAAVPASACIRCPSES